MNNHKITYLDGNEKESEKADSQEWIHHAADFQKQ